jgi:subtilisin family serine protease
VKIRKILLLLSFLGFAMLFIGGFSSVNAKLDSTFEEKIYSHKPQKKNFEDSSVIVIMDKSLSSVNKVHSKSFFKGVEIEDIVDLTRDENQINSNNRKEFRQILKLTLKSKGENKVIEAIKKIEKIPGVKYVGPNQRLISQTIPNDYYFHNIEYIIDYQNSFYSQYNFYQIWDHTIGSRDIRVGLLDSGVANHPDLNDNVIEGWNFLENSSNTSEDLSGHGTNMAGIIGAVGNNNQGIAGINWKVSIVPLKIARIEYDIYGNPITGAYSEDIIAAINYATSSYDTPNPIKILNFSYGGYNPMPEVAEAIRQYPGLLVCAAGNGKFDNGMYIGVNTDEAEHWYYPGYYGSELCDDRLNNIINVGNLDRYNSADFSSNYGEKTVNIFAPGCKLLSTFPYEISIDDLPENMRGDYVDDGYLWGYGTSISAAFVSGTLALLLSYDKSLSALELKNLLLNSATYTDVYVGNPSILIRNRLINPMRALQKLIFHKNPNPLNAQSVNINTKDVKLNKTINNYSSNIETQFAFYSFQFDLPMETNFIIKGVNELEDIEYQFYNENLEPITIGNVYEYENTFYVNGRFEKKNYYLSVWLNFGLTPTSQNISIHCSPYPILNKTFMSQELLFQHNEGINILNDMNYHYQDDTLNFVFKYCNNTSDSFYDIELSCLTGVGYSTMLPKNSITIYDYNYLPLRKLGNNYNFLDYAVNNENQNFVSTFLLRSPHYIHIKIPYMAYNKVILKIGLTHTEQKNNRENINLIDDDRGMLNEFSLNGISSSNKENSIIKYFEQPCQIHISLRARNNSDVVRFIVGKIGGPLNILHNEQGSSIDLIMNVSKGNYYFGYFNNCNEATINISFDRKINNINNEFNLILPDTGSIVGSEVRINQGIIGSGEITEGYSRCLYFNPNSLVVSFSRLDYDWISDSSFVTVTQYGTVLCKNISSNENAHIYAIYKNDPSIIYVQTLMLKKETNTAPLVLSKEEYIFVDEEINLNIADIAPYNFLQYYEWSSETPNIADFIGNPQYGHIKAYNSGLAIISGQYLFNSRITIKIYIYVGEQK